MQNFPFRVISTVVMKLNEKQVYSSEVIAFDTEKNRHSHQQNDETLCLLFQLDFSSAVRLNGASAT